MSFLPIPSLVVREFVESDAVAAEHILRALEERTLRLVHDVHRVSTDRPLSRSLVAEVDGSVVGLATVKAGLRHPERLLLVVDVEERFRRIGIGSALLSEIRRRLRDRRPFKAQAALDDLAASRFLTRYGFTLANRTWEGVIDPADTTLRLDLQRLASEMTDVELEHPRELPRPDVLRQAASYFDRWYQLTHDWDPAAPWTSEAALSHFCGEDLTPGSLVLAYRGEQLIGAASLVASPFDTRELYLADIGVTDVGGPTATSVAAALTLEATRFAAGLERPVRFEIDEANTALWQLLLELNVNPHANLGFYVETRPGTNEVDGNSITWQGGP